MLNDNTKKEYPVHQCCDQGRSGGKGVKMQLKM